MFGGDIITQINKTVIDSPETFVKILQSINIGDKLSLTVLHENKFKTVSLNVVERPLLPWDLPREDCRMARP